MFDGKSHCSATFTLFAQHIFVMEILFFSSLFTVFYRKIKITPRLFSQNASQSFEIQRKNEKRTKNSEKYGNENDLFVSLSGK